MNEGGKSDSPVVPAKPPNKAASAAAEVVEERGLAEGNTTRPTRPGRSAGSSETATHVAVEQAKGTTKSIDGWRYNPAR